MPKQIFKKGTKKHAKIDMISEDGDLLEEYPTDSFDGSNTGDGELYYYNGGFFEIDRERDGNKVLLGQIKDKSRIRMWKKQYKIR